MLSFMVNMHHQYINNWNNVDSQFYKTDTAFYTLRSVLLHRRNQWRMCRLQHWDSICDQINVSCLSEGPSQSYYSKKDKLYKGVTGIFSQMCKRECAHLRCHCVVWWLHSIGQKNTREHHQNSRNNHQHKAPHTHRHKQHSLLEKNSKHLKPRTFFVYISALWEVLLSNKNTF